MTFRWTLLIALPLLFLSSTAAANDLLPNTVGNTWTYESGATTETVEITRSSGGWRSYDDFAGLGQQWIWTHDSYSGVYGWNGSTGYMKLFDAADQVGTRYNTDISHCGPETVAIAAKNQTITTPAGTFRNVLRLSMTSQCRDAGTAAIWFAPDVGIVKWEEITIAGSRHFAFVSGTVDGVDYPIARPAPVTIRFEPSRDTIWLNLMPSIGGYSRQNTDVSARLVVENTGDRQIDLDFTTSQRFDILVEDASGNRVAQWAANKRFMQATSSVAIKPGDQIAYEGTVQLPEKQGRYRVRMELRAENRHVAAESSVQIMAVY